MELKARGKIWTLFKLKKCEFMSSSQGTVNIHFWDGTKLKRVEEANYLGCRLQINGDATKEVQTRLGVSRQVLKRLEILWNRADCEKKPN